MKKWEVFKLKMFMSDNNSGVDPKIMEAIVNINKGHDYSYGTDDTTEEAERKISELLGKEVDIYFVTTGTEIGRASCRERG